MSMKSISHFWKEREKRFFWPYFLPDIEQLQMQLLLVWKLQEKLEIKEQNIKDCSFSSISVKISP